MGQAAAKKGDQIIATDTHIVLGPDGNPKPPVQLPFSGYINNRSSSNVNIMGQPAATVGSTADNSPPHIAPPGTTFQTAPTNKGSIKMGSQTVNINGQPAARQGDMAMTCNDPADAPVGTVVAVGTVFIGG